MGQSDIQSSLPSWKDPGYTSGRYELSGHIGNQLDSAQICGSESKVRKKNIGQRRERKRERGSKFSTKTSLVRELDKIGGPPRTASQQIGNLGPTEF